MAHLSLFRFALWMRPYTHTMKRDLSCALFPTISCEARRELEVENCKTVTQTCALSRSFLEVCVALKVNRKTLVASLVRYYNCLISALLLSLSLTQDRPFLSIF